LFVRLRWRVDWEEGVNAPSHAVGRDK
jgi:hypothetical protein